MHNENIELREVSQTREDKYRVTPHAGQPEQADTQTERRSAVTGSGGAGGVGSYCSAGTKFVFGWQKSFEIDSGDGCTTSSN